MEYTEYLDELEKKLSKYFDIQRNFTHNNLKIDLFAKYFARNERYIATKKATIYAIESNEYCFVKGYENLNQENIQQYTGFLKASVDDFVNPHSEHMSSIITGVIVTQDDCDGALKEFVKKFKYHKSFAFGFKGWVDIRLILVLLNKGEVITNKKGREVEKVYRIC